jgi:hypothetical protein
VFACILTLSRITDLDPGWRTSHFWGGSVTASIRIILGLNTHSKHLKITTMFTVRLFSPYKDYSSFLRCKLIYVFIFQLRNCIDKDMLWIFGVFDLFPYWWTYFVVSVFCRTIRICVCFFSVYTIFGYLYLCVGHWSGYKSTNGPWGAWVGHASAGPLGTCCGHGCAGPSKGIFNSSSVGTLTPLER